MQEIRFYGYILSSFIASTLAPYLPNCSGEQSPIIASPYPLLWSEFVRQTGYHQYTCCPSSTVKVQAYPASQSRHLAPVANLTNLQARDDVEYCFSIKNQCMLPSIEGCHPLPLLATSLMNEPTERAFPNEPKSTSVALKSQSNELCASPVPQLRLRDMDLILCVRR